MAVQARSCKFALLYLTFPLLDSQFKPILISLKGVERNERKLDANGSEVVPNENSLKMENRTDSEREPTEKESNRDCQEVRQERQDENTRSSALSESRQEDQIQDISRNKENKETKMQKEDNDSSCKSAILYILHYIIYAWIIKLNIFLIYDALTLSEQDQSSVIFLWLTPDDFT